MISTVLLTYFQFPKAIKIKCIKEDRQSQTKYEDLEGNEIKVNDGNTFVQICPTSADVVIEAPTETNSESTANTAE